MNGVGIGYTLGTGRLFCEISEFHAFAEKLVGHPILTHEFADRRTWEELRQVYESKVITESRAQREATLPHKGKD